MSYDLCIFYSGGPTTDEEAAHRYYDLCDRPLNAPGSLKSPVGPKDRIAAFVAEMMLLYPPLNALPDDAVDLSPWSSGPDVFEDGVIVCLCWSQCRQTARTLIGMAWRHRLVVYNPQDEKLYSPPAAPETV